MSDLVKQLEALVEIQRTEPIVQCGKCGTKNRVFTHIDDRFVSASLLKEVLDVVRKEASGELVPVAAPAARAENVLEFSAPGPVGLTPVQRAEALSIIKRTEKDTDRHIEIFGLLKTVCREIRARDLSASKFFREHDERPTTDKEMLEEILKWVRKFAPAV